MACGSKQSRILAALILLTHLCSCKQAVLKARARGCAQRFLALGPLTSKQAAESLHPTPHMRLEKLLLSRPAIMVHSFASSSVILLGGTALVHLSLGELAPQMVYKMLAPRNCNQLARACWMQGKAAYHSSQSQRPAAMHGIRCCVHVAVHPPGSTPC